VEKGMESVLEQIFALTTDIRYVALYRDGELLTSQRPGVQAASAAESDKYEELFVNPTMLKAATQRGNLDCGGLEYVLIRYGNFYQLVIPRSWGHASLCFELRSNPLEHAKRVSSIVEGSAK
jgi:hypothetical protein